MKQVAIVPKWTIQSSEAGSLPAHLIDLLVQVSASGSLQSAARLLGLSYRHAWALVRQGEVFFGAPLMVMERGRGSTLTKLGARMAWADRRVHARLKPVLDSLSSELAVDLQDALDEAPVVLRIHASHGFAIERLLNSLAASGLRLTFCYASCTAAAAALRDRDCDVAGLHIPIGEAQAAVLEHYRPWLADSDISLINLAIRRQGLMVRAGNPKGVMSITDLMRSDVRFINRQPGSGTRLLLEKLLLPLGLDPLRIAGFESGEYTHAAVAAHVASGMADVGFGLEAAARDFHLEFIPVVAERYFLLFRPNEVEPSTLAALVRAMQGPPVTERRPPLPGYDFEAAGTIAPLHEIYPSLA